MVLPHLADAYALARWLTGNATDAEDVVQEACLRAFRGISGFAGGNARAWLLTITRHAAFTWLGKNRSPALVVVDDLEEVERRERAGDCRATCDTPETALIAKADAERLEAAIAQLPLPFREALVLRDVQGLDYRGDCASDKGADRHCDVAPRSRTSSADGEHCGRITSGRDMTTERENDAGLLLHAYLDGELDPAHAMEMNVGSPRSPRWRRNASGWRRSGGSSRSDCRGSRCRPDLLRGSSGNRAHG